MVDRALWYILLWYLLSDSIRYIRDPMFLEYAPWVTNFKFRALPLVVAPYVLA
jgi:hypothetical protein